ncbi:MAG: Flp family type IVb pilin [Christensenellales bacterium]|jgi:pilus assembly protein Flp/PilA
MKNMVMKLIREEDGQGMVEYGLIIAVIAVMVVGVVWLLGPKISELFDSIEFDASEPPAAQ